MNKGRFLITAWFQFTTIYMPLLGMMKNFADEEGGGEDAILDEMFGSDNEQASPDDGKADDAPGGGQDASGGDKEEKADEASSDEEQAPVVSEEDLEKALSPQESPEEKAVRLERDYSASSKEAKRLNTERTAIAKSLEEQGIKLVVKDGKAELIPTEKYSADGKPFEVKVSDMSVADQEVLESGDLAEIQKVIDKVAGDARSKLVRPAPTRDKEPATLSEERKEAIFNSLAEAKDEFDVPKNPSFAENRKVIESYINNSARPEALREAFAAAPEEVAALVNSHINAVKAALIERAKSVRNASDKKTEEARKKADQGMGDEGTVTPKGSDDYMNQFGPSRFG